ncbi:hemin transporter [Rhodanobacter sp. FW510-R12]|uniref:hemin uptake protein HemP n=1 Tax=unclassified Rhodanobacter TaxID=2621553 RepID=UPI0007A5E8CC|nr:MULTISPECIES: hemin uptake protein HemP [unclassified Rhodanobacter]KZC16819.1 hemin transporter [Rhodanobacter sp. FW104-R8]KZC27666.1 hemin transporter [Rhodanobacter sp. FW510-T8]KZC33504.1 hemin transporter [Rhodanobacter sp. FW510-R10]KZC35821.1 hemin transporter [Rhodanobacter denitrificans]
MPVLSLRQPPSPRSIRRPAAPPPAAAMARRVSSHALLEGERELVIQHQGSEYHLRLTRNDKLILTK